MIRTIILDDQPEQVSLLNEFLEKDPRFELKGLFTDPLQAIPLLSGEGIDLIVSDVEMPGIGGFEFLRAIKQKPLVIFISAYPEYAIDSFEFDPLHFLTKPLQMEGILQAMEKAVARIEKHEDKSQSCIFIKIGSTDYQKLLISDIIMIEATGNGNLKIYTSDMVVNTVKRLRDILDQLNDDRFMRVQKSFIINLEYINKIKQDDVLLSNNKLVPIGRGYRSALRKRLGLQ